jgi:chemotaxis protein methyltransferase CheR
MQEKDIENIEVELLLDALHARYGYDFNHYAKASLKRRLQYFLSKQDLVYISDLIPKLLHDQPLFTEFVVDLSVTVTEMFRDPDFYVAFKEKVIPTLSTYPFIKIWHAGCATGEEVYSMAILLYEAGLLERSQLYATDFNQLALKIASKGIYPIDQMKTNAKNYSKFSQVGSLSDYYHAKYDSVKMKNHLRDHITFSRHNLVNDHHFGEMNVIICRNVLIYFDTTLQNRVISLFKESLMPRGILCLGRKESLINMDSSLSFEKMVNAEKIYRLIATGGHHDL